MQFMIIWTPSSPDVFEEWVEVTAGDAMPPIRVACIGCTDHTPANVRVPSPLQAPSPEEGLQEQSSALSNASGSSPARHAAHSPAFARASPGFTSEAAPERPLRQRRVPPRMRRSLSKVSEQYSDRSVSPASSRGQPLRSPARASCAAPASTTSASSGPKRARTFAAPQAVPKSPQSDRSSLTPQRRPAWNSSCAVPHQSPAKSSEPRRSSSKSRVPSLSSQRGMRGTDRRRTRDATPANIAIGQEAQVSFVLQLPAASDGLAQSPAVARSVDSAAMTTPSSRLQPVDSPAKSSVSQHSSQMSGPSGLSRGVSSTARGSAAKMRLSDDAQEAESAASLAINHTKCDLLGLGSFGTQS